MRFLDCVVLCLDTNVVYDCDGCWDVVEEDEWMVLLLEVVYCPAVVHKG